MTIKDEEKLIILKVSLRYNYCGCKHKDSLYAIFSSLVKKYPKYKVDDEYSLIDVHFISIVHKDSLKLCNEFFPHLQKAWLSDRSTIIRYYNDMCNTNNVDKFIRIMDKYND